jgi:hypothetical protein
MEKKQAAASVESSESSHSRKMRPITLRPRRSLHRAKVDADLNGLYSIHIEDSALSSAVILSPFPANLGLPDLSSEETDSGPFRLNETGSSNSQAFRSPRGPDEATNLAQEDHHNTPKCSIFTGVKSLLFCDSNIAETGVLRPRPQRAGLSKAATPASTSQALYCSVSSAFDAKRRKTSAA